MKNRTMATQTVATLALMVAMVLWASSFIALKFSFRTFDPMVVIFGRMLVASFCFSILFISKRSLCAINYQKGDWKSLLFMAFCEPCLYFMFEAQAVQLTTASQAGVITAILPIMVMITAVFFLKEQITKRAWFGALLALFGVCWLTVASNATEEAPNPALGNFLEFLAMVCAAAYTIAMKKLTVRYSPLFLTAIQAFIGCVFFFPLIFLPETELPQQFDMGATLAVIYLGAVITIGAYGLYNYALKLVPANQAAACVNLIPIFAVILGWALLGEVLNGIQLIASGLILAGVYFTQRQPSLPAMRSSREP